MTAAANMPTEKHEPAPSGYAIRVRHLWHRFGAFTALRDVTFDVAYGEIFGFIGPNGAGKTTTIRTIATLIEPMAGRVEVGGYDVAIDPGPVRRIIGYMPDHAGVYERISVREYLEFFADAYEIPSPEMVDVVMELTDLLPLENKLVAEMSKGMKQRLQLGRVLLHDPKILVLDEPASDLDPRARIEIRDLLLELRALGKTIFLSSHILTELSDIVTSVGIMEKGQLVVAGPIDEIGARLEGVSPAGEQDRAAMPPGFAQPPTAPGGQRAPSVEASQQALQTPGGVPLPRSAVRRVRLRVLSNPDQVRNLLLGGTGIVNVEIAGRSVLVEYQGDEMFVAQVVQYLVGQGVLLAAVEPERNELERIFLEATKGELQ